MYWFCKVSTYPGCKIRRNCFCFKVFWYFCFEVFHFSLHSTQSSWWLPIHSLLIWKIKCNKIKLNLWQSHDNTHTCLSTSSWKGKEVQGLLASLNQTHRGRQAYIFEPWIFRILRNATAIYVWRRFYVYLSSQRSSPDLLDHEKYWIFPE